LYEHIFVYIFRFPFKNKSLFFKWIAAMRRDKWQPSAADVICSEHFESHCFRFYNSQARLKEDAVPSIFKFPLHLQKQVKVRRALIRHEMEDATDAPSSSTTNLNDAAVAESRSPVNKTALLHHKATLCCLVHLLSSENMT
jgi:hypothetical protein